MIKTFEIHRKESYDYYYEYQKVTDEKGVKFIVWNLADNPENAIIGRSLFDADDWIDAVTYGMKLAKQGYDGIDVKTIDDGEDC